MAVDFKSLKEGEITELFKKFVVKLNPVIEKSQKENREKSSMEMMLNISALINGLYGENAIHFLANLIKLTSDKALMMNEGAGFFASPEHMPEIPEEYKKEFDKVFTKTGG